MSEINQKIVDMKCLEAGTLIPIEVPAEMYYRLQKLFFTGVPVDNAEDLQKLFANIKDENSTDEKAFHARTLLWFIGTIEAAALKHDKIVVHKMDSSTGKPISED